jgi:hypothetical protein
MFAVVRELHFDPEKLAAGSAQVTEFTAFHNQQPGCQGQVVVDAGAGHTLAIELWESEAQFAAAREAVGREADRLMGPMATGEGRVVGAGPVIYDSATGRAGQA